jgi:Spy/CpxP family protein refolding chaperone
MKITALIAAAALLGAGATYAQQHETTDTHKRDTATEHSANHETAGQKVRNAFHKLGEKTRHAFHRAGDKSRDVAHRDNRDDTRAMGASGSSRDAGDSREHRMDDAYSNWQHKQHKDETNR